MSELRLREQVLRHGIRRDDGAGNHRDALQQGAATNAFLIELVGFGMRALLALPSNKARLEKKTFASPESSGASSGPAP
jgi:hypothetical protein